MTWLVVSTYPSEKTKINWDDDTPKIWKTHVPNQQLVVM